MDWTCTLVEFWHSYDDFDRFIRYDTHCELQLGIYSAVQTGHMLQTISLTRRNGQHYSVLKTSTWWLDKSLLNLEASFITVFLFLQNITLKDIVINPCQRKNISMIRMFWGMLLSIYVILLQYCSWLECSGFVRTVRCGNFILISVQGWLTTSKAFTWTQLSALIAQCVKYWTCHLVKGVNHCGNWETIS